MPDSSRPPVASTTTPLTHAEAPRGIGALLTAFGIWGVLVLYLRQLQSVPALQIMAYRLVFCCVFVFGFLWLRGALSEVTTALRVPALRLRLFATAALISVNWLAFTWAVTHGHVLEASLGYFINPLVNVLLAVVILRERLRIAQWSAVALAASGVLYLTWLAHTPPWLSLLLAVSFGSYGLLRKTLAVDAMAGLAAETALLTPFGVLYLAYAEWNGSGALRSADALTIVLLVGSGLVTALPLWLFAYGARRVPYATVGLLQYVAPTLQLLFGIWVFHERFDRARAAGFVLIWSALVVYALDGLRQRGKTRAVLSQ